uniref:Variant surface glycoprotein 1125.1470 n=1 Tax=Trypanosoma brucei TaxID=5691 RepID=A0A1J0R4J9_9TRYP|nr:variant surface glycoprotein 1125.1470 [Trypanosoma brucei]
MQHGQPGYSATLTTATLILQLLAKPEAGANEALAAKGFDDACKLVAKLRAYGHYAQTMAKELPSAIFATENLLRELETVVESGALKPEDATLNFYIHCQNALSTAKQAVTTQLSTAVHKAGAAAEATGALMETVQLFFISQDGTKYCMTKTHSDGDAATLTQLPSCKKQNRPNMQHGSATVTSQPEHAAELAAVVTGAQASRAAIASKGCRITETRGNDGIVETGGISTFNKLLMAAGLLKITNAAPTESAWDNTGITAANSALEELDDMKSQNTKGLETSPEELRKLQLFGTADDDYDFTPMEETKENLSLGTDAATVTVTRQTQQAINKVLEN